MRMSFSLVRKLIPGLLGIAFLASCSSTPAHLKTISPDSPVVVSVDLTSLAWKGDLQNLPKTKLYRQMKEQMESGDPKRSEQLKKYSKDPFAAGIDFLENTYFFVHMEPREDNQEYKDTYLCFAAELSNSEKFAGMITEMFGSDKIETKEAFQSVAIDEDVMIGWTNEAAVLVSSERYDPSLGIAKVMEKALTRTEEQSVLANANFKSFLKKDHDLSAWVSTTGLKDEFERSLEKTEEELTAEQLADNYLHAYLDFEDGAIKMGMDGFLNQALPEKYRNRNGRVPEESLIDFVPGGDETYALMTVGWDMKASEQVMRERFGEDGERFLQRVGMSFDDLFESLTGDMVVAVPGFEELESVSKDYDYETGEFIDRVEKKVQPQVICILGTGSDQLTAKAIKYLQEDPQMGNAATVTQEGGKYKITSSGPVIYLVQKEKALIISNSPTLADAAENGGFSGSEALAGSLRDNATNQSFSGYFNLNYDNYPMEGVQSILGQFMSTMLAGKRDLLVYEGLYITGNEDHLDAELRFHQKDENSLVVMINMLDGAI